MFSDTDFQGPKCWQNVLNTMIIITTKIIIMMVWSVLIRAAIHTQTQSCTLNCGWMSILEWAALHSTELIKLKLVFLFCQSPCVEGWGPLFNNKFLFHFSVQRSTIQSGGVWIRRIHLAYWSVLQKQGTFNNVSLQTVFYILPIGLPSLNRFYI